MLHRLNLRGENSKQMFPDEQLFRLNILFLFVGPLQRAFIIVFSVPVAAERFVLFL